MPAANPAVSPPPTAATQSHTAYPLGDLLDDESLRQIADFAANLCDAPIALVSFVEEGRQWFAARKGIGEVETSREHSFCARAMLGTGILIVPDATKDPRFAANPLVAGEPGIRFYAGAPLTAPDGRPLGALCVIDLAPRDGLTATQAQGLQVLACNIMAILAHREQASNSSREISEQDMKFRLLADTMPQMVWSTRPDGFHDYYNARWYEFTGMPVGSTDGEAWNGMFHPDDQARAWALWRHSLDTGEPYEIEYRLRNAAGEYRWTLGRALPMRDDRGQITRWFGTCTDIHDQKMLQVQREVISQELSHRIKNIFSVISGLITFSTRHRPEFREAADDLRQRIRALGRAHDFVRPHSEASRPAAPHNSLTGMLRELLAAYVERVDITGRDIAIDDRSATPLALLFHELATNAAKYGALSAPEGQVTITSDSDGQTTWLEWQERGGPRIEPPASDGFGSQLIELSVVRQMGGRIERDWQPEGLKARVEIPATALSRA